MDGDRLRRSLSALVFQAEGNCLLFLYIFVARDRGNPLLGARQIASLLGYNYI